MSGSSFEFEEKFDPGLGIHEKSANAYLSLSRKYAAIVHLYMNYTASQQHGRTEEGERRRRIDNAETQEACLEAQCVPSLRGGLLFVFHSRLDFFEPPAGPADP